MLYSRRCQINQYKHWKETTDKCTSRWINGLQCVWGKSPADSNMAKLSLECLECLSLTFCFFWIIPFLTLWAPFARERRFNWSFPDHLSAGAAADSDGGPAVIGSAGLATCQSMLFCFQHFLIDFPIRPGRAQIVWLREEWLFAAIDWRSSRTVVVALLQTGDVCRRGAAKCTLRRLR